MPYTKKAERTIRVRSHKRRVAVQCGDLVLVHWDDSASTGSWSTKQEVCASDNHGLMRCKTVGWVTKVTRKSLTIHGSESANQVSDIMCVPRSCVVTMERLRPSKKVTAKKVLGKH